MEKASLLICVGIALILSKYSQALEISQCVDADHIEDHSMEGDFQQCILQDNTQDKQVYGRRIEASITIVLELSTLTKLWLNQARIVIRSSNGEIISIGQDILSPQDIDRWKIKIQFEQFRNGCGILKIHVYVNSADYVDSRWLRVELLFDNETITTPFSIWFPMYRATIATGDNFEAATIEPDHSEMTTVEHSCSEALEAEREKNWKQEKELEKELKIMTGKYIHCLESPDENAGHLRLSINYVYFEIFCLIAILLGFAIFGFVTLHRYFMYKQETWIMHDDQPNEVKTIKPRTRISVKQADSHHSPESQHLINISNSAGP